MAIRRSAIIGPAVVLAVAAGLWWYNWHLERPLRLDRQLADCEERARLTTDYLAGLHVCLHDRYGWSDDDPYEVDRFSRAQLEYMQAH